MRKWFVMAAGTALLTALPVLAQSSIDIGDSVEGELDRSNPTAAFELQVGSSTLVSIAVVSDDFDTVLTVEDADGEQVALNDDGGDGTLNSLIGPLMLEGDSVYTVSVYSYESYNDRSAEEGEFTLTIEEIETRETEIGSVIEFNLEGNETRYYAFEGTANEFVSLVDVSSADVTSLTASLLSMEPSSGQMPPVTLTSSAENYGRSTSTLLGPFALPADGTYYLKVQQTGTSTNSYTLRLESSPMEVLTFGEAVEGELTTEVPFVIYAFEGTADTVVDIVVSSGASLDSTLTLYGPANDVLATNDDTNGIDPALYGSVLPETGTYVVVVKPYSDGTGSFSLSIRESVIADLDAGTQTLTFDTTQTRNLAHFEANANERVRLNFRIISGDNSNFNITLTQDTFTIGSVNLTEMDAGSFEFVTTSAGDTLVTLQSYSLPSTTTVEVSIERLGEVEATAQPTVLPASATPAPTDEPTDVPTEVVTDEPTDEPTEEPTEEPTQQATPIIDPTEGPTEEPSVEPTGEATSEVG